MSPAFGLAARAVFMGWAVSGLVTRRREGENMCVEGGRDGSGPESECDSRWMGLSRTFASMPEERGGGERCVEGPVCLDEDEVNGPNDSD
jgi:hypothetical protein